MGYFDCLPRSGGILWDEERTGFSECNGRDNPKIQRETGVAMSGVYRLPIRIRRI